MSYVYLSIISLVLNINIFCEGLSNTNNKTIEHIENEVSIFDNMNYFFYQNSRFDELLKNSTSLDLIINITDTTRFTLYAVIIIESG